MSEHQISSLRSEPAMVQRRRQIQKWVVIWRLMALSCIPILALVNPAKLGSVPRTFSLFLIACIYTVLNGILSTSMPERARAIHFADLMVWAAFILAAGEPKIVFIMTMASCSIFLAYDSPRIRDWLPKAGFLSAVYFAANDVAGIPLLETIKRPPELGVFVLIYFFALGFTGFAIILDRLSSLELEGMLEQQRKGYRRRLHDDLGNTLCGLHFKIETLVYLDREAAHQAIKYLAGGYKRAVRVLGSIRGGMEESGEEDIDGLLALIKTTIERDTGVQIALRGSAGGARLSPEITQETMAIVKESVMNACKHSGAKLVEISVARRRRCLRFAIVDEGIGYDEERLRARQKAGHMGVKGMFERAQLIGANLDAISIPGQGTRVELEIKIPLRTRFGRFLEQDQRQVSKLFSLIVFLRIPVLILVLVQIGMLPDRFSAAGIVIGGSLVLDCLFWVALRPLLYQWLKRRPWLIVLNFVYFAAIFYIGQKFGYVMHYFYMVYPETGFMLSGLVLGARGNLALASGFSLAIALSYFIVPPDPALVSQSQAIEDLAITIVAVLAIAIPCGLAGGFTKRLEEEQLQEISRSLERERERLTVDTHHQLHDLITGLGERLGEMARSGSSEAPTPNELNNVKLQSRDLKQRLRSIIVTLESPANAGE